MKTMMTLALALSTLISLTASAQTYTIQLTCDASRINPSGTEHLRFQIKGMKLSQAAEIEYAALPSPGARIFVMFQPAPGCAPTNITQSRVTDQNMTVTFGSKGHNMTYLDIDARSPNKWDGSIYFENGIGSYTGPTLVDVTCSPTH